MKEYYLDNTGEVTFKLEEPVRNPLSDKRIAEIMYAVVQDAKGDFKLVAYNFARAIEKEHGIV